MTSRYQLCVMIEVPLAAFVRAAVKGITILVVIVVGNRDRVGPGQPARQIDIRAALGTEWPKCGRRRARADRATALRGRAEILLGLVLVGHSSSHA
jgi:hypothetical protein